MKTRFKTIKSVKRLVYGALSLRALSHQAGVRFSGATVSKFWRAETCIYGLVHELETWSRSHRRLHGRPAVIEDWLQSHAGEIRTALDELSDLVDELATDNRLNDAQRAIVNDYRLNLHMAWQLDLLEDEHHEAARRTPKPPAPPEQPPPDGYGEWGSMTVEQCRRLNAALLAVLVEKLTERAADVETPALPALQEDDAGAIVAAVDSWLVSRTQ